MKFIAKKAKPPGAIPILSNSNGDQLFTGEQKATEFCNQFLSVYSSSSSNAPILPSTQPPTDPLFDYNLMFIPDHLVYSDLVKSKPKLNKSPDGIPSLVLRKCAVSLAKPICHILRMSFMLGKVPDLWKKSIITPIYKGKNLDKSLAINYRPIALTSPISKLAESLVYSEIKGFLEFRKLIPPFQHGFRPKKSVTTLLLEEIDDISLALESKKCVDLVTFDFKKLSILSISPS